MSPKRHSWLILAILVSLLMNVGILGLASLLSQERDKDDDIIETTAVSLVSLAPPEPPRMEEAKEPEKPKPEQKNEFTPDLARPDLSSQSAIDIGVAVNLGGMAAQDIGGQFVFEAYELDQPPQVIARTPPVYPYKAREKGIEGAVQIKLLVNLNGSVGQVIILDARPPGYFEDAVMKSAQNWKFAPGRIGGEAVTAWVVTTVRFQL